MKSVETEQNAKTPEKVKPLGDGNGHGTADEKKASRLERLKKKIKKLQGKDPDIYPMW